MRGYSNKKKTHNWIRFLIWTRFHDAQLEMLVSVMFKKRTNQPPSKIRSVVEIKPPEWVDGVKKKRRKQKLFVSNQRQIDVDVGGKCSRVDCIVGALNKTDP